LARRLEEIAGQEVVNVHPIGGPQDALAVPVVSWKIAEGGLAPLQAGDRLRLLDSAVVEPELDAGAFVVPSSKYT
jgi:hypothetical protein